MKTSKKTPATIAGVVISHQIIVYIDNDPVVEPAKGNDQAKLTAHSSPTSSNHHF
jgi:hypothetical protein